MVGWLGRISNVVHLAAILMALPGSAQETKKMPMHVTVRGTWTETRECTYESGRTECKHCRVEGRLIASWDAEVVAEAGRIFTNPTPGRVHVDYLEREYCPFDGEGNRNTGKGNGPLISPVRLNRGPDYAVGEGALGIMVDQPVAGLAQARNLLFQDFRPGPADFKADSAAVMANMKAAQRRYNRMVGLQAPFRTSASGNWDLVGLTMLVAIGPGKGSGSVAWEEQGAVNDEAWDLRVVDVQGLTKGANWARQEGTEDTIKRKTRYEVSWSFVPVEDGEATVEILDYEDWIPEGNIGEPGKPGNTLQVKVKAHKAGHSDQPLDRKVNFTFTLEGTSMEPGVCTNWPPKPGMSDYGLKILAERNKTLDVIGPDEAKTRKAGKEAELTVSAIAYGAWTRLKVTAESEDGHKLKVRFHDKEVLDIPLPHFEGENHIALAYLKRHGLTGVAADWDKEMEPLGNAYDGDGLTLYEEYRGFAVKGRHLTGHPSKKDVFIHDETGQARGGIALFEKITGLVVHSVDLEELGTARVVNRNHAQEPHAVDQHGILLKKGPRGSTAIVYGNDKDMGSPPRAWPYISLPYPGPVDAHQDALVAHEICHCVGVQHHGDDLALTRWFWALQGEKWVLIEKYFSDEACKEPLAHPPAVIQAFFEADSRPLTQEDPWLKAHEDTNGLGTRMLIFSKDSPFSGDEGCVMRYVEDVQYAFSPSPDSKVRYIVDPKQTPKEAGATLCETKGGISVNAPNHRPVPRSGKATRGNCKAQIVVNDSYGK